MGEVVHDQDKLAKLVGINFHRALNAEKIQMQFKGANPPASTSWALRKQDVRIKHVSQTAGPKDNKKENETKESQIANAILFDDINQYYCNFDSFEVTQKKEFREQIK